MSAACPSNTVTVMNSDFVVDLFNANCAMALEISRQFFATDEGLARRLLHKTQDAIDAILSDFDKVAAPRSNVAHQSSGHQDPPPGGDGNGHQPGDANKNIRQPGNQKDPDA